MSIQRLNESTPSSASQVPFWDPTTGVDRRAPLSDIATVLQALFSASGAVTQYASPTATGFSITVSPPTAGASMFLLISPSAGYAAGTIVLPAGVDGQELTVHCRQAVTTLTLTPQTGDGVGGGPSTLAAGGYFRLRYDLINKLWCRIG